jgi:DNA (cytosine-5)-methyltransferase 1
MPVATPNAPARRDNDSGNHYSRRSGKHDADNSPRVGGGEMSLTFLSLFCGIGGFDLGFERAGMRCIGQVEINPFCQRVLAKHWPSVWRHDDIKTFKSEMLPERPDVICGGFPCQDISHAGKRAGITGERSGLWSEFHRIICEIRPRYVVVENVAALLVPVSDDEEAPIATVLGDLAESGYDAEWDCIPSGLFGTPHLRERVFLVAYTSSPRREIMVRDRVRANEFISMVKDSRWPATAINSRDSILTWLEGQSEDESPLLRNDNGIPFAVDRLQGLGNAVVPQVAELIGRAIVEADNLHPRLDCDAKERTK